MNKVDEEKKLMQNLLKAREQKLEEHRSQVFNYERWVKALREATEDEPESTVQEVAVKAVKGKARSHVRSYVKNGSSRTRIIQLLESHHAPVSRMFIGETLRKQFPNGPQADSYSSLIGVMLAEKPAVIATVGNGLVKLVSKGVDATQNVEITKTPTLISRILKYVISCDNRTAHYVAIAQALINEPNEKRNFDDMKAAVLSAINKNMVWFKRPQPGTYTLIREEPAK